MKTKLICSLLFISMSFIACKKETVKPAQPQTTAEKLLGTWRLVSTVVNDYYNGSSHITTTTWLPGDYIEFRNNGKAYGYNSGSFDTTAYGIVNDTQVWFENATEVYDIKILTASDLQLYRKQIFSPTEYSEATATANR